MIHQPNHIYARCVNDILVRTTVVPKTYRIIISFPDLTSFHFGVATHESTSGVEHPIYVVLAFGSGRGIDVKATDLALPGRVAFKGVACPMMADVKGVNSTDGTQLKTEM